LAIAIFDLLSHPLRLSQLHKQRMDTNEIEQQISQTLVGISADGSEDWSREFLLDEEEPLAMLKSPSKDHGDEAILEIKVNENIDEEEDEDWNFEILNQKTPPDEKTDIEEDEEDWDIELGIADEVKEAQDYLADGLRLVMNDPVSTEQIRGLDDLGGLPDPQATEALPITIPSRCKMARNLLNSSGSINLVIFPKPPSLFSLKLDRARKQTIFCC
jgi:hypothetical protein